MVVIRQRSNYEMAQFSFIESSSTKPNSLNFVNNNDRNKKCVFM